MRSYLCSFGHSSPRRLPTKESNVGSAGLSASIVEFMKPRCLYRMRQKNTRRPPMNIEIERQEPLLKDVTSNLLTLQEWILSSPSSIRNGCSNRVYPTLVDFPNIPGDSFFIDNSFSIDRLPMEQVDEGAVEEMEDSSSVRPSRKRKKRVSFRLPEVADIFIQDAPGEHSGE